MSVLLQPLLQMNVSAYISAILLVSAATVVSPVIAISAPRRWQCNKRMYAGFDGRLKPHLLGRLPKTEGSAVGFEVVHGEPLVALPRQLFAFSGRGIHEMDVPEPINGISINQASQLEFQSATGFRRLRGSSFELDKTLTKVVHGRLYGSGVSTYLEIRSRQGILQFIARKQDGRPFLIVSAKGTLRAASWNDIGLAAVIGNSLYVWEPGTKKVIRLVTDVGLSRARDAVLVGHERAVVALMNSVVMVTDQTITVVAGMPLGRCRFQGSILYLLDGKTGWIWGLSGLDQLGTKNGDTAYADELLRQSARERDELGVKFQEAARILGCRAAHQQLTVLKLTKATGKK